MQFGIRDLLILMFVAALVALTFLGQRKTKWLDSQINDTQVQVMSQQLEIESSKRLLKEFGPRMDYAKQIQTVNEPAVASFDKIRERYSKIEPQPAKVVMRSVPEFQTAPGVSTTHLKLSVPSEHPVFLRSGFQTEDPERDTEKRNKENLDEVNWMTDAPCTDSKPYEILLEPGLHDLWITSGFQGAFIKLKLGNKELLNIRFQSETSERSTMGPSGREPYAFSLNKSTKNLRRIGVRGQPNEKYEYWIWLSSKHGVTGFEPYPKSQAGTEVAADE